MTYLSISEEGVAQQPEEDERAEDKISNTNPQDAVRQAANTTDHIRHNILTTLINLYHVLLEVTSITIVKQ